MKGENNYFAKGEWAFSAFLPERLKRETPKILLILSQNIFTKIGKISL
jgi:hypothetical protein